MALVNCAALLGAASIGDLATFAFSLGNVWSILGVALGLGLVIFFHELGHFAVAKWCNVHVERFSIGFGPILWSWKWGETEYALSAIPFGGYVKMLGQDDLDPSQLSSEDIARDPRSYSAKSVPQRMAIISAGVIMNVITAVIFFGLAFGIGIEEEPPLLGTTFPGKPAWVAGLREGDRVTAINGRAVESFGDIQRGVALTSGAITVEGVHADDKTFSVTFEPDRSGSRRTIGVSPSHSLTLARSPEKFGPTAPGTAAAKANPPFEVNDEVRYVDGVEVTSYAQLHDLLARRAADTLEIQVARGRGDGRRFERITVGPTPFRTLGLGMDVGKIVSIRKDSPSAKAGIQADDKITKVDDRVVGSDIDPLRLPDVLFELRGKPVQITVSRAMKGSEAKEVSVTLTPEDRPGWIEVPFNAESPLPIPAIGAAFNVIPTVLKVDPDSPAAKEKIVKGDRVRVIELIRQGNAPPDGFLDDVIQIQCGPHTDKGKSPRENNWAYAFWAMQQAPGRAVKLTVEHGEEPRDVLIQPEDQGPKDPEWFSPLRGLVLRMEKIEIRASGLGQAVSMGLTHTRNTIIDIYLTLRSLLTGDLSPKEFHGPVMIAHVAYIAASHGVAALLLFLGLLSVNLAVINFLPIPVLDGGHMVFLIWEAVTRRKPSERVLIAAQYFGMAFVLGLMLAVLYLDIFVHMKER